MRRNKRLHLLLMTVCLMLHMETLPVLAAHTDVTARITSVSTETEISGSGNVSPDGGNDQGKDLQSVQTGDDSRTGLWTALLFISGCVGGCAALSGKKNGIL